MQEPRAITFYPHHPIRSRNGATIRWVISHMTCSSTTYASTVRRCPLTSTSVADVDTRRVWSDTQMCSATSSLDSIRGRVGRPNTNGRPTTRGSTLMYGNRSSSSPSRELVEMAMAVSSKVSWHAVSTSAISSASRRPPGSAIYPDQGSSARSARLMKRQSRPDDLGARISPTAASKVSGARTRRGDCRPRRAFTSRNIESVD